MLQSHTITPKRINTPYASSSPHWSVIVYSASCGVKRWLIRTIRSSAVGEARCLKVNNVAGLDRRIVGHVHGVGVAVAADLGEHGSPPGFDSQRLV